MMEDGKKVIFVGSLDLNSTDDICRLKNIESMVAEAGYGYNQDADFELRLMAPSRYSMYVTGEIHRMVKLFKALQDKDLIK